MRHSLDLVVLLGLQRFSERALLLSALMLSAHVGNASQAKVSVTATVNPIVQLIVDDQATNQITGSGKTEVKVSIPVVVGMQTLTVRASASGQKSDLGCTLFARLDAKIAGVSLNGKPLSDTEDAVLADPMGYDSPTKLSLSAPQQQTAQGSAIVLRCRPK